MASKRSSSTKRSSSKKSSSSKKVAARKKPEPAAPAVRTRRRGGSSAAMPDRIFAQASPHSLGGVSMFAAGMQVNASTCANFMSEPGLLQQAAQQLREAGFEILHATDSLINIAGSARVFEDAFGAPLTIERRPVIKTFGLAGVGEFIESCNADMPGLISMRGTGFDGLLEGVAIEEPRYYMGARKAAVKKVAAKKGPASPAAFAPPVDYWHLDVPADVALGCNADLAHRAAITGRDVVVAMVDSGWYRHPFFTQRGYRADTAVLGPGAVDPATDESGHGTGESANIFALAPDVRLRPVKMNFANSIGAFNTAVGLGPSIITCSWGSSLPNGPLSAADIALANAIAAAVASGIVVVFSAGNGHWGFPGQHPDVISAGGVYLARDGSTRASDYASGFASKIYPGRNVPDLSGLVGMTPGAIYIMLPLEPGDDIDVGNAGRSHPEGDQTAVHDGWAAFSGTSAAAPQLAGAAALVRQVCPQLDPAGVREILMSTARDVTEGWASAGTGANPATVGPDIATGHGLVDAHRATILARLRCRSTNAVARESTTSLPLQLCPDATGRQPAMPLRRSVTAPPQWARAFPSRMAQPVRQVVPVMSVTSFLQTADEAQAADQAIIDLQESDLGALDDMVRNGQVDPGEF